ncbi:hypothetical protein [Lacinutrix mariniflava]|uniref:hypothetical protein n=1 Tax=Lacinutrix mariniflava TaxID=342955 RepID=UPI0006E313B2|nr:hypothetical protein [Lacinutrix mariniflava]
MKNLKILFVLCLFVFKGFGQDSSETIIEYKKALFNYELLVLSELQEYNFGNDSGYFAVQPKLMNEKIKDIFNTVVLANKDRATNGTSVGYQQNKDKGTISVNANFNLTQNYNHFLKLGINGSGSSTFGLFENDSWNKGVGGNIGYLYKINNSTVYYSSEDARSSGLKRIEHIYSKIKLYHKVLKEFEKTNKGESTIAFLKKFKNVNSEVVNDNIRNDIIKLTKKLTELNSDKKDFFNKVNLSEELESILEKYENDLSDEKLAADDFVKNQFYEFDKKNDITYGYRMSWFDVDLSLSNQTFKFNEDNISKEIDTVAFKNLAVDKELNKLRVGLSGSYNYTLKSQNYIFYLKTGIGFNSGSFLGSNIIDGTPEIDKNLTIFDESNDENEEAKGSFESIKRNLEYGNFDFYTALFFGKNQKFGVNINLRHSYLVNKPEDVFYKNNFTALVGPIFKAIGSDGKGAILGIDFGFEDAFYKTKINDNFTARLRVGIPFNIFTK